MNREKIFQSNLFSFIQLTYIILYDLNLPRFHFLRSEFGEISNLPRFHFLKLGRFRLGAYMHARVHIVMKTGCFRFSAIISLHLYYKIWFSKLGEFVLNKKKKNREESVLLRKGGSDLLSMRQSQAQYHFYL
jgi:hypothetical protein